MKIVRPGDFKIMFNEKNRLFNASMLFDQLDGGEDALRDLLDSRKDLRRLITKRSFWIDMPAIALFLGDYDGDDIKRLVFDCASCYISHSIVAFLDEDLEPFFVFRDNSDELLHDYGEDGDDTGEAVSSIVDLSTRFVNTVLFSNPNSPVFRFIIDTMTINVGRCVGLMRSLIFMFDCGFIKSMDDLDDIFGIG